VLTAGTRADQQQVHDGKSQAWTVVTLMVTPSQAEQIALASVEGQVMLTLRNPLDIAEPATPGAHLARLVDDPAGVVMPAAQPVRPVPMPHAAPRRPVDATPAIAALAPASPVYLVEAIRAGKRTQETLK
jgi:Flp pilus assembly protein CpaB